MEIIVPQLDEKELNKIKDEKLKEVLFDEEIRQIIYQFNFDINDVKNNLYYFNEYKKDKDACLNCTNPLNCKKKGCHLRISLKIDKNKKVSLGYYKCKYQVEIDKLKEKFVLCQFDNNIFSYKLKDCLDYFAKERQPLIKNLLEFKNNPIAKNIFVSGSSETGKSFILSVFSVFLAKLPTTKSIAFVDCPNEFVALERNFQNDINYYEYYIDQLKNVQYLFLDDLGKEFKNSFVVNNVILPILKHRKENNLVTFISSNYIINEFASAYAYGKDIYNSTKEISKILKEDFKEIPLNGMKFSVLK